MLASVMTITQPAQAAKETAEPTREQLIAYTEEVGEQYGICPELIQAMIQTESSWDADAENGGCKGLMQVAPKWHGDRMERLGCTDIYDPYQNILVGVDYLAELAEKHGDVALALDYYNGNSKAEELAAAGKMSTYSTKVLTLSEQLERQNGK